MHSIKCSGDAMISRCDRNALRQNLGLRLLLIVVPLLSEAPASRANLLLYESFDYPIKEQLGEATSRTRWSNDKEQFTIVPGSLDYPSLQSSTGNRLNVATTSPNLDSVRTLDGSWPKQSQGALYISFILRLQSTAEISDEPHGTSLLTVGDTFNHTELFGINLRQAQGGVHLGVLKYSSTNVTDRTAAFFATEPGANLSVDGATTYLIVAKYEWVEGEANDVLTLWVNPGNLGAGEDATSRISISASPDRLASAGRLTLSRGPNVNLDELRIGQTWADVTPAREQPRSLLGVVGVLVGVVAVAGLWITVLRRSVRERSLALAAQTRERQHAEHQRLMEQERARIAHDLHDELGADIVEISMLATRAKDEAGSGPGESRCLGEMVDKSRQMVAKLEEIVWAMNPEHDSLGDLVSYFSFFADRFLGLAGIKLTVDASAATAHLALDARVRHQLFLGFKEALTNVVKHSGANEVRLVVCVTDAILRLEVADNGNGPGTPDAASGAHEGIASMRRRMEELGGQFEIVGAPGQGTTVTFSVPFSS